MRDKDRKSLLLFEEIATVTILLERLLTSAAESAAQEIEAAETIFAARRLVNQVGWMADTGTGLVDDSGVISMRGGAETWLLPASFSEIGKEGEQ